MTHHHSDQVHHHEHHHHHHELNHLSQVNRAFAIGIVLNLVFTLVEFVVGFAYNSLALLSDAAHNLSDVASLLISLFGLKLAQQAASHSYTYGYKKASVLASLLNALLLFYIVGEIVLETIARMNNPAQLSGLPIMITAFVGIFINGFSAYLFHKDQSHDLNIRGAFLHLLVDALVSFGVVVSGLLIYFTGGVLVDTIISLAIAVMIVLSTIPLFRQSLRLLLDGVPNTIDLTKIRAALLRHPAIGDLHHLHVWALGTQETALTVHLVLHQNLPCAAFKEIKAELQKLLLPLGIQHCTFEFEFANEACEESHC